MAQHDYIISNQTFPSTRSDINSSLSAIASNNSGATEPSTTYAYQWWYDTSSNILRIRNASNDAWISIGTFNQGTNSVVLTGTEVTFPTITTTSIFVEPDVNSAVTINGTNFVSIPIVEAINDSTGQIIRAVAVSYTNSTTISATFNVPNADYYVRIENNDGYAVRSTNAILSASSAPTWTTAAGTLGTIAGDFSGTVATVVATSDSAVTYSETTNVLTNSSLANCSLNTSTGVITTTDFGGASTTPTTYNFTIRATDAENQTADRNFSLTSSFGATGGGQFN